MSKRSGPVQRKKQFKNRLLTGSASFAALSAFAFIGAARGAGPAYNIYPISPLGTDTFGYGAAISTSGTYAAGMTGHAISSGNLATNGVLYNVASGVSTLQTQSGVTYVQGRVPINEYTGVPKGINNSGIMVGGSGAGNVNQLGAPTVWQNGAAANLKLPFGAASGVAYDINDSNTAVGYVKGSSAGADQAAIFFYNSTTPSASTAYYLSTIAQTDAGGTLQDAFGINNNNVIVGTATDPTNAAITSPFIYTYGDATAHTIPNSSSAYNAAIPDAISNSGLVTGSETVYSGSGKPFIYNMSNNVTTSIPLPAGTSLGGGKSINDAGQLVGTASNAYAIPFLYDGTASYDLSTLLVNNATGAWHLSDNTSSSADGIANNGDIVGRGYYNGVLTGFIMVPTGGVVASRQTLTFNNAGGTGNGTTWDTTSQNWNNGTAVTTFSSANSDYVLFTDANNGHYNISIPATVTPGSITFNNSSGNYIVSGVGSIGGGGIFYKFGTASLTLNNVNTWSGPTNITAGTVVLGVNGALPASTNLNIYGTGTAVIANSLGTAYALKLNQLGVSNGAFLDLGNNALIIHNGFLSSLNYEIQSGYNSGAWNGSGIMSSMAGAAHPLMALGSLVNDNGLGTSTPLYGAGGSIASTFAGAAPVDGDVLIKYTYYGDANLDGKVDGTDYGRIDAALIADQAYLAANPTGTKQPSTGWYNGDFNYDGYVNGSDYTLMDNAFNSQGAVIANQIVSPTVQVAAEIAGNSVPEPASLGVIAIATAGLLSRRRRGLSS